MNEISLNFFYRPRSRRLCFHRCLPVHNGGGVSVSVQGGGSLARGVSVREIPTIRLRAGGTHPTGMNSCSNYS